MRTQHEGGRWCWCGPLVGIAPDGSLLLMHEASAGKRRDVLRVWWWTAVQM